MFDDLEFTELFINNVLFGPSCPPLEILDVRGSWSNQPLMDAFHKNTAPIEIFAADHDFIRPIERRNRFLVHIRAHVGWCPVDKKATHTSSLSTMPVVPSKSTPPVSILPPLPRNDGLWPTILAEVGKGSQGSTPVFTILNSRLATWMEP